MSNTQNIVDKRVVVKKGPIAITIWESGKGVLLEIVRFNGRVMDMTTSPMTFIQSLAFYESEGYELVSYEIPNAVAQPVAMMQSA